MKKLLQISKLLMLAALCIGSIEFIKMYRSGELGKIYEEDNASLPVIKTASSIDEPLPAKETGLKLAGINNDPAITMNGKFINKNYEVHYGAFELKSLSVESFSRAAPGREYFDAQITDSAELKANIVNADSTGLKSANSLDSALAKDN